MKKRRMHLRIRWRTVGLMAVTVSALLFLLLIGITRTASRLFPAETAVLHSSKILFTRPLNPLHLPLRLLQRVVLSLPSKHVVLLSRLPSVLLGILSYFAFAYVCRRWYGRRSMILGCTIFATSAWFLHVSRFAGFDIEYLAGMLTLLAIHIGLYDHDNNPMMMYVWLLGNLLLLSIPGFVWFVLLSLIWQWRVLIIAWRNLVPVWNRLIWCIVCAAGLAPLAYALFRSHAQFWLWLGVPSHFANWQMPLRNIGNVYEAILFRGPHNPQLWLGRLPLLDAFLAAMFLMGVLFYLLHWKAARTRLIGGYLLLGSILVGLHNGVQLSIIVPLIYIVAVGGIAYSLYLWLRRFPRNQIARAVGILGIILLVSASCLYNLQQYFIAWPANQETRLIISRG